MQLETYEFEPFAYYVQRTLGISNAISHDALVGTDNASFIDPPAALAAAAAAGASTPTSAGPTPTSSPMSPVGRIPKFVQCAATLFLFRTDRDLLRAVMQAWHTELSDACDEVSEERFCDYMLSVFQHCVETYFSRHWDATPQLVKLNIQYKEYIEQFYCQVAANAKAFSSTVCARPKPPPEFLVKSDTRSDSFIFAAAQLKHLTDGGCAAVAAAVRQGGPPALILFHANFSERSRQALRVMRDIPAGLAVPYLVALTEVSLLQRCGVHQYPTLLLLMEDKKGSSAFGEGTELRDYPLDGVLSVEAVKHWVETRGSDASHQHINKMRKLMKKALVIEAKNKFAARRQLHAAVKMLNELKKLPSVDSPLLRPDDDRPMAIFLGGGMAAGKSTAVNALTKSEWYKAHEKTITTVAADEFKMLDPLFNVSDDTHKRSTQDAEQLLVKALEGGRDVIVDGTMMWRPFVEQAFAMVRQSHVKTFKRGKGWVADGDEEYFVPDAVRSKPLKPYRIRMVGCFVHPALAVQRGILRQLESQRGVPVKAQLRSYKLYSEAFESYAAQCDEATLYDTNQRIDMEKGETPLVAAEKREGGTLDVVDERSYAHFLSHRSLNEHATCADDLFPALAETPLAGPASPSAPWPASPATGQPRTPG